MSEARYVELSPGQWERVTAIREWPAYTHDHAPVHAYSDAREFVTDAGSRWSMVGAFGAEFVKVELRTRSEL